MSSKLRQDTTIFVLTPFPDSHHDYCSKSSFGHSWNRRLGSRRLSHSSTVGLSSCADSASSSGPAKAANCLLEQAINFANNGDRAKALIEELNNIPSTTTASTSPRFESFRADVGDRPSVQKLVHETVATFGRIDVVVSNAGWTRITNFSNLEEGMVDEVGSFL